VTTWIEKNGCAQFIRILMKLRIAATHLTINHSQKN